MSEARNLQDENNKKYPELPSESYPIVQELSAEAIAISTAPQAIQQEYDLIKRSAFTNYSERFACFLLKLTLVSAATFAAGAFLTINVLMDRIDHKSGWLKEFLQFISETSKYLLK